MGLYHESFQYFVSICTSLGASVDTTKTQVTSGIFHEQYHKRVLHALLFSTMPKNTVARPTQSIRHTSHDGRARCTPVESTTALLSSDWLYFLTWSDKTEFTSSGPARATSMQN